MAWRKFHNGDLQNFEIDFIGRRAGLQNADVRFVVNEIRQCCGRNYALTRAFIAELPISKNEESLQVKE